MQSSEKKKEGDLNETEQFIVTAENDNNEEEEITGKRINVILRRVIAHYESKRGQRKEQRRDSEPPPPSAAISGMQLSNISLNRTAGSLTSMSRAAAAAAAASNTIISNGQQPGENKNKSRFCSLSATQRTVLNFVLLAYVWFDLSLVYYGISLGLFTHA
jgi:hypothetical protein